MPAADATAPAPSRSGSNDMKPEVAATAGDVAPLTPRPRLFVALLVVFGAWLGVLVWMYVTTVYPQRPATGEQGRVTAPR